MWDKIALTKQLVESMGGITRRTSVPGSGNSNFIPAFKQRRKIPDFMPNGALKLTVYFCYHLKT